MDQINKLVEPGRQFFKDSYRLVKKCTKPDRKGNKIIFIYSEIIKFILTNHFF